MEVWVFRLNPEISSSSVECDVHVNYLLFGSKTLVDTPQSNNSDLSTVTTHDNSVRNL